MRKQYTYSNREMLRNPEEEKLTWSVSWLPRENASWAGTRRINLKLPGQMTAEPYTRMLRSHFKGIEATRVWNILGSGSAWLEHKPVKLIHFTGLVDF